MDQNKGLFYSIYALTGLSIMSCLLRFDYNVFFAFAIIFILRVYYPNQENQKLFGKIILHLLIVGLVADLIWMIVMLPYWSKDYQNTYWESLGGLRVFIIILAFLEFFIKGAIGYFIFSGYQSFCQGHYEDLFKIKYNHDL